MTKDTTFREFVEQKGIDFTQLIYDSNEYKELARQFREAKLELIREDRGAGEDRKAGGTKKA